MIIKYEIKQCSKYPEGRSIWITSRDTLEDAVSTAKTIAKENLGTDFFVQKAEYASEENLRKRFAYQQYLRWATYLDGLE